jgi:PEP-CTERM motif
MQVLSGIRLRAGFLLFASVAMLLSAPRADAAPIVLSFDATFLDPGFDDGSDDDLVVASGAELTRTNGTDVGSFFFDDEFVDVVSTAGLTLLHYRIQGGEDAHPENGAYSLTGWGPATTLTFSDLQFDVPAAFTGVTLSVDGGALPRVIGVAGGALVAGTDYLFNPLQDSLTIYLGGLGVLNGAPPLGTLSFTLALEARDPEPPQTAVPEPGSLMLLGTGLAAAARAAGRARAKKRAVI